MGDLWRINDRAAFILMYITYGFDNMSKVLPINFRAVLTIGLLVATLSGIGAFVFGEPFLTQTFGYFNLPIMG